MWECLRDHMVTARFQLFTQRSVPGCGQTIHSHGELIADFLLLLCLLGLRPFLCWAGLCGIRHGKTLVYFRIRRDFASRIVFYDPVIRSQK